MTTHVLHITASVPMPADMLSQAEALVGIQPALNQFEQALPDGSTVVVKVISKRPRKEKEEAAAQE
jgi:hypothetical protein